MGVRNEALAAYVAEPSKRGGYRNQKPAGSTVLSIAYALTCGAWCGGSSR